MTCDNCEAAVARAERAEAELVRYKKAVADKLHWDMRSVLSSTPEDLAVREMMALRAQVEQLREALRSVCETLDFEGRDGLTSEVNAALFATEPKDATR